jgi:dipeptidyl aminopeptidase/acylaminoacyl peptidase
VLLPHGGPIAMDSNDFDPLVQFLADRGYAVLQVNFRGSAGFGHAHMSAGLKRWGLEMQDDLSDAVKWLTESGVADPARVCIVGGSYGGYAALMGGAKTPELYRCVVSFAGVSDLIDLGAHEAAFLNGRAVYAEQVGSLWSDRDRLKATSPSRLAAQFRAPVLLLHGTLDRSVPFEQSESMADALRSEGRRFRFVKQEGGDHHLSGQAQRTEFYREIETFLAEHLAPAGAGPAQPGR